MKFNSSEPDIEGLVRRIDKHLIDLQPDFQRGEVWGLSKKQRLIDTILRGWHIPPLHLVDQGGGKFDVLDGQQRLTAIYEFWQNKFAIDGTIKPHDDAIAPLDRLQLHDLPDEIRERFALYTIRVFNLTDFDPAEPYELFFRLNQPTSLTEAEKRNAFVGKARNQVKKLTASLEDGGLKKELIGFSNTRMSYDEVLARFILTIESGTLSKKLTSQRITERYRDGLPFHDDTINLAESAARLLIDVLLSFEFEGQKIRLNKATLHTWLCISADHFGIAYEDREDVHTRQRESLSALLGITYWRPENPRNVKVLNRLYEIYNDRSTSRVLDVASVILRDFCGWAILQSEMPAIADTHLTGYPDASVGLALLRENPDIEQNVLADALIAHGWGAREWV